MKRETRIEQLKRLAEAGPSGTLSEGRMELRFFDASAGIPEEVRAGRREAAAKAAIRRAQALRGGLTPQAEKNRRHLQAGGAGSSVPISVSIPLT